MIDSADIPEVGWNCAMIVPHAQDSADIPKVGWNCAMIVPHAQDSADIPTVQVMLAEVRSCTGQTEQGRGTQLGLLPDATCRSHLCTGPEPWWHKASSGFGLDSRAPELQSRKQLQGVTQLPRRSLFASTGNTLAKQGTSLGMGAAATGHGAALGALVLAGACAGSAPSPLAQQYFTLGIFPFPARSPGNTKPADSQECVWPSPVSPCCCCRCSEQQVHDDLPSTSIIMCFVDEVWSTLLRSVHSVLSRSPPHLVEEIILVDDFSTKEYLKEQLDTYMAQFPKVKILHLQERHGLIRARLAGAKIAKGAVLTFLDSHVECNVGWLEPLLDRVRLRRTKVACPVIEVISDKDMSYMTVDNFQRGIFTWPMNFGWRQIPQEVIEKNKIKETDIIRCPVMAGGLFSIDKKYFSELGMYDPGLDVWGGENMEISFKVWMCGGEIEIVPCSRVGHIFRNDNPYSFPKDRVRTVERNLARVAEVWLDEYKELFYGHAYHLLRGSVDVGDLGQQMQLRKKLQCKSFRWYLQNVYPDLEAPLVKASGLLTNVALAGCIAVEGTTLVFEKCDVNSTHGQLCLAPAGVLGAVGMRQCQARSHSLAWLHRALATAQPGLTEHLISEQQHLLQPACLAVDPSFRALRVTACDPSSPHQKWHFGSYHAD
ncbi:hypothetical protein IHE44_0014680 [Lamprotornis superbus]|uniref:Polypeptide N-acetylgalactosaminyltransferase n=1 Tax=Lamprotornis superbus TaxID=245042 RepID=A0A835NII9_9PASS|nr:hypothetical protein IHE44_0014680 [Lamprotornis superbus]